MNLIFHQAALGDFVLTFELLRRLKGPTTVVAPGSKAALAARVLPAVRPMDIELWEFARLHARGGPTTLSPAVAELFEQARLIVSFVSSKRDAWAVNLARLTPRARRLFVQPRPPAVWHGHVCDWHAARLAEQGVPLEPAESAASPAWAWGTGGGGRGGEGPRPVIVHPGSGGQHKCWPLDRFERLVQTLRDRGRSVAPVLGEAEAHRWPAGCLERWRDALGARLLASYSELHEVLRGGAGYIGNDSGPTQLAAQVGLPTLALFGPSDPRRWAPRGPRVTLLAPPAPRPMRWLNMTAVLSAYQSLDGAPRC